MTALTAIQQEWAKMITGVLLWDLSAAFETLNTNILCQKLRSYGFDDLTCAWFGSFLTGRSQKSKLEGHFLINNGLNQGGILSLIIFVIYGADMDKLPLTLALGMLQNSGMKPQNA